jgi:hypothetical protein
MLIISLSYLGKNGVDDVESICWPVYIEIQRCQPQLDAMLKRRAFLLNTPFDEILTEFDLQLF